jgi:hypothetical protein
MLIEKSFPDSFLENKTLGDLCLWENKEKQRWNMSIRGSRVMSWMPGLRDLGLPRHSHMGIDLAVWTFFSCSEQRRSKARVKSTSQNAHLFLLTFPLKARFQGEMGKSKSAQTPHGMKEPSFNGSLWLLLCEWRSREILHLGIHFSLFFPSMDCCCFLLLL